jgi:Phosphatidylglycerophosphate synthase
MLKLNMRFFRRLPAHEKKLTFSTLITLIRVVLTPFIVWAMVAQYWGMAFTLFLVACISDMIDGKLARLLGQQTFLGACLDPLADKILILSVFFTLAFLDTPLFVIPGWFVWIVLFKELILVGGAVALYSIKGHIQIRPTLFGKATTVAQMAFIMWLFTCYFFQWLPTKTYYSLLGLLVILVMGSLLQYVRIGLQWLRG